jgi:beta-glucanase (GH16 family)
LAVLVVVGGTTLAVWRVGAGRADPPALSAASPPTAGVTAPASPQASPSQPGSGMGQPRASRSGTTGSKTAIGGSDPSRVLVDADDFSGAAVDKGKWGVYESTSANGSIWSPSAVRTANGELQIIGTGNNPTGKGNVAGGLCWCGANGNRLYGIWQVRTRLDAGAGYGPIIGLWPQSNNGDTEGYISAVNAPAPDRKSLTGRLVWPAGGNDSGPATGNFTVWHTFTIEWRATFVKLYIDGKPYYDSTKSTAKPVISHAPLHLYMQLAIGPKNGVPAADATTPAHVVMHIDWVRFYR